MGDVQPAGLRSSAPSGSTSAWLADLQLVASNVNSSVLPKMAMRNLVIVPDRLTASLV